MGEIIVKDLKKTFKVSKRSGGLKASLKHFVKREYQEVHALKGVSFHIKPGELVGYIGPNGAGKSTTVKIMSGILTPTGGECQVSGLVPYKQRKEHVANIGVVFGQRSQLWWDVPVIDSFELLRDIYKIPNETYEQMKKDLIQQLNLEDFLNVPVRQLSLGQRMRCEIAASLLHNPPVLFLDEPTIGLDAVSKLAVRQFIRTINEKYNTTVILTTHDMDDIEALCNRIMVIGKGQILYDGELDGLRAMVADERQMVIDYEESCSRDYDDWTLEMQGDSLQDELIQADLQQDTSWQDGLTQAHSANSPRLPYLEHATLVSFQNGRGTYHFDPNQVKASDLIGRAAELCPVKDVFVHSTSIEEIIAKLYEVMDI